MQIILLGIREREIQRKNFKGNLTTENADEISDKKTENIEKKENEQIKNV